ncbi:hybrid sensor histidine kinase/response regulator [Marinifilum caeruleilacunae]|uniref:histidine kinase n=1 Tax=Marinifilum caeruleilacunae TaxID=2499076 RepID=A0ABX1WV46_9BACT|nr:hybrid sensor histidine kinase/response regulator [Marinifilum caeruleilacunae]NOU59981.1 hybrid sensor histidine kinase/response regulator [Marinifilum caeruleilacunae]
MEFNIPGKTPTVLVVDDNPNNLKIVALTLRELNFKIVIATNGKDALDLVERTKPDLILLDVMMPEMDGFEVCEILKSKEENKNLPIIFLTAVGEKSKIVKGFELGGVDYITKPFNKEELIIRIKTHLELKFTRDELQTTTDHLSELNELKDKMFSVIGHDLRGPLGNIKMTLDLLSKGLFEYNSEDYKETMSTLVQSSEEVSELLENLLGWAKSQSGILKYHPEDIAINNLIESTYFMFKGNLTHKNISFEPSIQDNLNVNTDAYMLKMILKNVMSNAIKFTHEGGNIRVSAEANNGDINISISDNGIGISSEDIPKLFDEKEHLSTYGTNGEAGSGLGLKVANSFATNMDGKIDIKSKPGEGCTITLKLPVSKN